MLNERLGIVRLIMLTGHLFCLMMPITLYNASQTRDGNCCPLATVQQQITCALQNSLTADIDGTRWRPLWIGDVKDWTGLKISECIQTAVKSSRLNRRLLCRLCLPILNNEDDHRQGKVKRTSVTCSASADHATSSLPVSKARSKQENEEGLNPRKFSAESHGFGSWRSRSSVWRMHYKEVTSLFTFSSRHTLSLSSSLSLY